MTPSRRFSTGGRRDEDNIEVTTSVSAGNTSEESPRRFKQAAEKLFPYRPGPQGSKPRPEPKERPGMKPRNHRSVSFRHISTWPPLWTQSTRPDLKTVKGEVGFLKYVHHGGDRSTKCYLVIEHQKQTFLGVLSLRNMRFCVQITDLLQGNIGRSIKEIGDLEILDDELAP
jgi:hypothetical protein